MLIALCLSGILVLGVLAQWLAWRTGLPSILLLLLIGFGVGPGARWGLGSREQFNDPGLLFGDLLLPVVSLAVSVILYEGGLTLEIKEIKGKAAAVIRKLVSAGMLVTWLLVSALAHFLMAFGWDVALLLGAVLVVTGPTVIGPLLRQIRPRGVVGSILKWEGIVIDPIGATLAVLVYEAIHLDHGVTGALQSLVITSVVGTALGYTTARGLLFALRRHMIPHRLDNSVSLALVLGVATFANYLQEESGLLAATVMGITLANQSKVSVRHLVEFKENLRVLLISCLFIVLAAKLEPSHLSEITEPGVIEFILLLILVIRPLAVFLSTIRSGLELRERIYLSWLAPRGIVAAAVASVFALKLAQGEGHADAERLEAITFMVIIATVTIYGLTAGPLARMLGLAERNPQGFLILGAHPLARAIGNAIKDEGFRVLLVDNNRGSVVKAKAEGLEAVLANVLTDRIEERLDLGGLGRMLAITPNDEVNQLAAEHFAEVFTRKDVYRASPREAGGQPRTRTLFGEEHTLPALYERREAGASVRRHPMVEESTWTDHQTLHGEHDLPLFLVDPKKRTIEVFASDVQLTPRAGQVLISLHRGVSEDAVPTPGSLSDAIAAAEDERPGPEGERPGPEDERPGPEDERPGPEDEDEQGEGEGEGEPVGDAEAAR